MKGNVHVVKKLLIVKRVNMSILSMSRERFYMVWSWTCYRKAPHEYCSHTFQVARMSDWIPVCRTTVLGSESALKPIALSLELND
eukprot:414602-Hanusia_phi.AAC.2